tara:strand:- start:1803 stop:2090 length:288 start_codon:yes stop_codon:yes gene_type:complete
MWHYEDLYNFLEKKKDDAVCLVIADVHNVTGEPYAILYWVQKIDGGAYRDFEVTETIPATSAKEFDDWSGVRKLVKLAWENNIPVYQNGIGRLRQ